jgi:hypothetical protein
MENKETELNKLIKAYFDWKNDQTRLNSARKVNVSARIESDIDKRFGKICKDLGTTRSELIRDFVNEFVKKLKDR